MKITDRAKAVPGVEDAYWNAPLNSLSIYYSAPLEQVKIGVVATVADAGLDRAVDKYTFISLY